jgi:translation elongation factor EF-1beta
MPENEGGVMDSVEEAVKTLPGVSQIEVMMVRRA